jgi:hypothetical protein
MIKLGEHIIGNYRLRVSTASLGIPSGDVGDYYLVSLTKMKGAWEVYVNLPKSEFGDIFKLDRRNNPTEETDMAEYNYYIHIKEYQMPMWKLSRKHVGELIARLPTGQS